MLTLTEFEATQPFATHFFTQALSLKHLVHGYILRGKDLPTMYRMALRIAQIINCTDSPGLVAACGQCQSCRWISENAHPSVMTVSNVSYYPDDEKPKKGAKPSQNLKAHQINRLQGELAKHCGEFQRVAILTGGHEALPQAGDPEPTFLPPKDWTAFQTGAAFQLLPLDRKNFADAPANKFLKTLEEPPRNVLFFLLTDGEAQLLETIVSRCQVVPFQTPANYYQLDLPDEELAAYTELLKTLAQSDYLVPMSRFAQIQSDTGMESGEILLRFQRFFADYMLRETLSDGRRFQRAKKLLQLLDHSKVMLDARTREDAVLESLFLQATRL